MSRPPSSGDTTLALEMRAMMEQMQQMLRDQAEQFNRRIDELERRSNVNNDDSGDEEDMRRMRRDRREREEGMRGIKIKVPTFIGKSDPTAYLEGETKIEKNFNGHTYTNLQKVQVAALEFKEYALVW